MSGLAERIDALLPQTQCTMCGYPACRPYAEAIANGEAEINQCPPGGDAAIRGLAALLGREVRPLNPRNGIEQPRRVVSGKQPSNLCPEFGRSEEAVPVVRHASGEPLEHIVVAPKSPAPDNRCLNEGRPAWDDGGRAVVFASDRRRGLGSTALYRVPFAPD